MIAFGMLALSGAAVAILYSKSVQIAYHRYALERLHAEIYAEPSMVVDGLVAYGNRDQFERQDEHCRRLADLGYFFHKRYEMENLPKTGEVHTAFWRLVEEEFPNRRYPTLSYPNNLLEVWDFAEHEPQWDAFVAKHNVADFVDRFMTQTTAGEPTVRPEQRETSDSMHR